MRAIPPIHRETERLVLRALTAADAEHFERIHEQSREAWGPWTPAPDLGVDDRGRFQRELDRTVLGARAGTHMRLAAFSGGEIVGFFALNEIVRGVFDSAYASWQVGAKHMGQGIGTEGVLALVSLAFDDEPTGLGLHRVQANIMPSNTPSLRIAEKVGFRREGVAKRYLRIAGRWEDHVMHAITKEEWEG